MSEPERDSLHAALAELDGALADFSAAFERWHEAMREGAAASAELLREAERRLLLARARLEAAERALSRSSPPAA